VSKVGVSLPPEREIATLTDFSRATVRKAIQSLVEEGLIVQRRGSGSFVASDAPRIERSPSHRHSGCSLAAGLPYDLWF
jgi:GntR family transcriptional regulator